MITLAEVILHKTEIVPTSAARGRRVFRCYNRASRRLVTPEIGAALFRLGGATDVRVTPRSGTFSVPTDALTAFHVR